MYSSHLQPVLPSLPCAAAAGRCEELCLYDGSVPHCRCSHRRLAADGKSCQDHSAFIVFSRVSDIESLHLEPRSNQPPPFPTIRPKSPAMRNAIGLAYSYTDRLIFYSDIQAGSINQVHFNGSSDRQLLTRLGSVEGLAYDARQGFLYWTSTSDSAVKRLRTGVGGKGGKASNGTGELVVQLGREDKPRGIDLDPCAGRVYWTNWNREHPAIQRAFYSGYDKQDLVTTDIHMPNGLALDRPRRKFYWADARLDKIEVCGLDGSGCRALVHSLAEHPFDLAVYDGFLFFTDWVLQAVVRINKESFNTLEILVLYTW